MKKTYRYSAPDIETLPVSYMEMLCESGSTEDYELVEGFEW